MRVTIDNYRRAESDTYCARLVQHGGFGRFSHQRDLVPIDHQFVIRLNRDTLYSYGVFDLDASPVTVTLPDAGRRYLALQIIDQDQYTLDVCYAPGTCTITREQVGTRYVCLLGRTFVNPKDAADAEAAHALQDAIRVEQAAPGRFEAPDWDLISLEKIRKALLAVVAANGGLDSSRMFGRRNEVDPVQHLLGTAAAWGGNPPNAALYFGAGPAESDGQTAYRLVIREVPVDGFWSVSVYNRDGFFEKNDCDAYTVNDVTARRGADGAVTIHFGGDVEAPNFLPVMPGWNYTVRLYRPRKEVLDGKWKFPELERVFLKTG